MSDLNAQYLFAAKTAKQMDYAEIAKSAGDIEKLQGYENLVQSIFYLKEIERKTKNIKVPQIYTAELAIHNVEKYKRDFEQGFRTNNEIIMLLYNNIVVAIIVTVSYIISNYLDFIRNPTNNTFLCYISNKGDKHINDILCIKNLENFNKLESSGDLQRFFNNATQNNMYKNSLLGIEDVMIIGAIGIGIAVAIIPLLQEIVYQVFACRIGIADYLAEQALFVELNKSQLDLTINEKNKRKVVKNRQSKIVDTLNKISNKINVDVKTSQIAATNKLKEDKNKATDMVVNKATVTNMTYEDYDDNGII